MQENIVEYEDLQVNINRELADSKGLSESVFQQIKVCHKMRLMVLFQMMSTEERGILRALAKVVECIDYELQELWGFPRDSRFHKWYELPGCTCPKLDNKDRLGTNFGVFSQDCPYHGEEYDEVSVCKCTSTRPSTSCHCRPEGIDSTKGDQD